MRTAETVTGESAPAGNRKPTPELMTLTGPAAIFLHCLPAHRGQEVEAEVIDGPRSAVFAQAANRLPTEQAALYALTTGDWEG